MRLDEMWGQNNQQNQPRQAVQPSPVMIQVWRLIVDKRGELWSQACLGIKMRFKFILVTMQVISNLQSAIFYLNLAM